MRKGNGTAPLTNLVRTRVNKRDRREIVVNIKATPVAR